MGKRVIRRPILRRMRVKREQTGCYRIGAAHDVGFVGEEDLARVLL